MIINHCNRFNHQIISIITSPRLHTLDSANFANLSSQLAIAIVVVIESIGFSVTDEHRWSQVGGKCELRSFSIVQVPGTPAYSSAKQNRDFSM